MLFYTFCTKWSNQSLSSRKYSEALVPVLKKCISRCRRQSSSESGSKKLRKSKSANGGTFSHHGDPHHHGGHLHDKDYYDRAHIRTDPAGGGEGGEYNH